MTHHIFGIRHHGPGSARSLRRALEELRPDAVLVEGPPDADSAIPLLAHHQMRPPVALLIYAPDAPQRAVFYPFARFSPEWQALHYALTAGVPARFIDLPQAHQLVESDDRGPATDVSEGGPSSVVDDSPSDIARDPIGALAAAAGYSDGERWWEHMVEQRRDGAGMFAAIQEAMAELRAASPAPPAPEEALHEQRREAWMRQSIRQAERDGFARIAVVCGAWHAPALADLAGAQADAALLRGLPKAKVEATWIPWTYGRLSLASGYGAGIESPGWYEHLFAASEAGHTPTETAVRWLTRAARLLRAEGLDISSAHVIEAVRLAESLAALRDRPLPGLPELNEAARAVFCFDSDMPMRLIETRLIVGETLGAVPDETPMVPLQQDLRREQRRLRLAPSADWEDLDLDLRNTKNRVDLDRSRLLHRLALLDVEWGRLMGAGGGKGTFRERWRIQWRPELAVRLIEAGIWGNTIADAAAAKARAVAASAPDLPALTALVSQALLADLGAAIPEIVAQLEARSAQTGDVHQMMAALPSLANLLRYGDVRKTDVAAVGHVVDGLVARICIGLPGACASLDDAAATATFRSLVEVDGVVGLLQNPAHREAWQAVLRQLADQRGLHGMVAGRAARLLLDRRAIDADEAARRLGLALSTASEPAHAAAWVEGFLSDSGALLLHDEALWRVIDGWVTAMPGETFMALLPLLRRTFATFTHPERRSLGERARRGRGAGRRAGPAAELDEERAAAVLPLVARLLGVSPP